MVVKVLFPATAGYYNDRYVTVCDSVYRLEKNLNCKAEYITSTMQINLTKVIQLSDPPSIDSN